MARFSDSEEKQLERLLTGLDLGTKKPSCLLREMKNLAADKISDNVLRTLWLRGMPQQMQLILTETEVAANHAKIRQEFVVFTNALEKKQET
ncbi:hypothetical protein BDFB_014713, partial [Asbolus verrucosus]